MSTWCKTWRRDCSVAVEQFAIHQQVSYHVLTLWWCARQVTSSLTSQICSALQLAEEKESSHTSHASNLKTLKYFVSRRLAFLLDLTPELAWKTLNLFRTPHLRWNSHKPIRGQVFMLNEGEVYSNAITPSLPPCSVLQYHIQYYSVAYFYLHRLWHLAPLTIQTECYVYLQRL